MRKFGVCLALTGATVWLTGCGMQFGGQSSSSRGGIAVVDLDKVASETGKGVEMKEALQIQESSLKQQLVKLRNDATTILEAKAKDLKEQGDEATDAAKREFLQMRQNANNNLAKAQNEAGTLLSNYQQAQVSKFRTELKPMLNEAATKRGLSVVIPKNDGLLLTVDPGVDITDDVIKTYLAKRPAPTAAAPAAAQTAQKAAPPRTAAKDSKEFDGDAKR